MKTKTLFITLTALTTLATLAALASPAFALDNIIHQYRGVRSVGMGGTLVTTGQYEDNFFGNPALVTQDPKWKVLLFSDTTEANRSSFSTVRDMMSGGGDMLQKIASSAGNNNHVRMANVLPAVFLPNFRDGKMSYAIGLLGNLQADIDLRRSYQLNPQTVLDLGPALTVGRKFLHADALQVGVTGHFTYRLQSKSNFTMVDLIRGISPASLQGSGEGARVDFDLGSRYVIPWKPWNADVAVGGSVNNVIAGSYNVTLALAKAAFTPDPINRVYNLGVSAKKDTLWKLTDTILAFEILDVGNNRFGSMFRTVHIGAETHWKKFAIRLGINQGYFTAGLGIDLWLFTLDLATYGEEMSYNVGGLGDRRYAAKIGFQF